MKKSFCFILLGSSFILCLIAQSALWQTFIPFESDDEGPVGIDITDSGEILVACYTNGPNESIWEGNLLTHSPRTKVLSFDSLGDLINTEDHGNLFNHNVTSIGITDNGYTLTGNNERPSAALLINFRQSRRDTIEYASSSSDEYKSCYKIKSSKNHRPLAFIQNSSALPGGTSDNFVIDLNDSLIISSKYIEEPDTINFGVYSSGLTDIDISLDSNVIISGGFSNAITQSLIFLISMDSQNNVLWEHYYDIGWSRSLFFSSVSFTPDGGCLAGVYAGDGNYIYKYDSEGELKYLTGPYQSSSYTSRFEFIHYIGNDEYISKTTKSDTIIKLKDTGTELKEDWSIELEGIKAARPVENGFVAAGVMDGNIWVAGFDATTGIEDVSGMPTATKLYQNNPNPFNPTTKISFALSKSGKIELSVYNVMGRLVRKLADSDYKAGYHSINFNADNLNSGVYYCTLKADGKKFTKRMLMVK